MTAAICCCCNRQTVDTHTRAHTRGPRPRAEQTVHFMHVNRERAGATCCTPHKGRSFQGRDARAVAAAAAKYSNALLTLHSTSAAGTRPATPKLNNLRSFWAPLSAQSVPPSVRTVAAAATASRRLSGSSTLTRKEREAEKEEGGGVHLPTTPTSSDWLLSGE